MKFHDTLNDKVWDLNTQDLIPEVKEKLEEIAEAFIEFLEIPTDAVLDKVITGSSASYNYNKYSDLDLHIIVDYDKIHEDCPLVNGYLNSLKKQFNDNHDITIHGVPVELYAEQKDQGTVHNGLYSLQTGWIDFPEKIEPTDNDAAVEAKFNEIKEMVDKCDDSEAAIELLEKIYNMRKAGLAEAGEFCTENLAFKKLRNAGCMDKLRQIKKEQVDKQLSLESYNESLNEESSIIRGKDLQKGHRYIISREMGTIDCDVEDFTNKEIEKIKPFVKFINKNLFEITHDTILVYRGKFRDPYNEPGNRSIKLEIEGTRVILELSENDTFETVEKEDLNTSYTKYCIIVAEDGHWLKNHPIFDDSEKANDYIHQAIKDGRRGAENWQYSQLSKQDIIDLGLQRRISKIKNESMKEDFSIGDKVWRRNPETQDRMIGEVIDRSYKDGQEYLTVKFNWWSSHDGTYPSDFFQKLDKNESVKEKEMSIDKVIREALDCKEPYENKEEIDGYNLCYFFGYHYACAVYAERKEDNRTVGWDQYENELYLEGPGIETKRYELPKHDELTVNRETVKNMLPSILAHGELENFPVAQFLDAIENICNDILENYPVYWDKNHEGNREPLKEEAIYNPSLILQAYKKEQEWLKSLNIDLEEEQAPEIMLFVIEDKEIKDTKLVNRKDVYTYKPEENEYYLDMTRDSGDVLTDYNLEPAQKLVDRWNEGKKQSDMMKEELEPVYHYSVEDIDQRGDDFDNAEEAYEQAKEQLSKLGYEVKELNDDGEFEVLSPSTGVAHPGVIYPSNPELDEDVNTLCDKIDTTNAEMKNLIKSLKPKNECKLEESLNKVIDEALEE